MPIYEYDCSECGEEFEVLVRMSSNSQEIACPKCKSKSVQRKLSLFGMGSRSVGGGGGSCATTGGG